MNFVSWMEDELSTSSASKYYTALKGSISDWALNAEIIEDNLLSISSPHELAKVVSQIKQLPEFLQKDSTGNGMYSAALRKLEQYLELFEKEQSQDIEQIFYNSQYGETEKIRLINARMGQGTFRANLIDIWGRCSVTGYKDVSLLIASHIKPWSQSSSTERLDRYNGFLLMPNIDQAFDAGMISFDNKGLIIISEYFVEPDKFGINNNMFIALHNKNEPYLEFHRKHVLKI